MSHAGKRKYDWLGYSVLLAIATVIAYSKIFHAGFMTWDDNEYVVHNGDVFGVSLAHISDWFSKFYIGNYHPLTMFSYALDFMIGGKAPFIYHLTNLLLHIANGIVLFFLLFKIQGNKLVAFFVALIFVLHPSQTECVSWIAERKTLLCAFFFLLALLVYTSNIDNPSKKKMIAVFLLGIAAMLSKGIAVALPVSLIAVDIWKGRTLNDKKQWLRKVPLFVVAIAIGIIAIKAQAVGKFLNLHPEYNWYDTIVYAGYAYVQYIIHLLVPVHLSVIYPYPRELGLVHYLFLLIAIGIAALGVVAYKKKGYILCGGILFYSVNIALVLQFVQFGEFLMADRYLYIAGIGILFPLVWYLFAWLKQQRQIIATVLTGAVAGVFLFITFQRNDIWLSEFNFFNAILEVFPNSVVAQYSMGGIYTRLGNYPEAIKHIDAALEIDPENYKAWYNKGVVLLRQKQIPEALAALNKCISINEYHKAYFSRALIYQETGKPELGIADIDKALEDDSENSRAYFIKAGCLEQEGNMPEAVINYGKAIEYENDEPLFYIRRGVGYARMKQNDVAMNDLNTAVSLNPNNGEAFYFRGIVKYHAGQDPCSDFQQALAKGYKPAAEAITTVCNHSK